MWYRHSSPLNRDHINRVRPLNSQVLSEAFKSAADDDKRLFMAASVGLRFAVEVDRLLAA